MIEATRRKLGEARFFHQHLMNMRQGRTATYQPEAFGYYFSAFISAARSVLWVLHHEEKEKWEAWEPAWKSTLNDEERKFLKFTNELRLDEVKRSGADKIVEWEDVAIHELFSANFDLERQHPAYGMSRSSPSVALLRGEGDLSAAATVRRRAYYLEQENGKEEVTALCERYLSFLDKVVREFEQAHQSPTP
jgi:hypothetical protein